MTKKLGRPTDNPKPHKLTVRLDDRGLEILDNYCRRKIILLVWKEFGKGFIS